MKKKTQKLVTLLIIIIFISIIILIYINIQQNKDNNNILSARAINLSLDDLPQGYIECNHNDSNQDLLTLFNSTESYRVVFFLDDCNLSNWPRGIDSFTAIFNSTGESINFFQFSTNIFRGIPVDESRNILGDESYGLELTDPENNTIGYVHCFRISKIFAGVSYLHDDYYYSYNLAKIVEQRIYDMMT